jgi:hypothetical protein
VVECNLAKVDVEGSNPFSRSKVLDAYETVIVDGNRASPTLGQEEVAMPISAEKVRELAARGERTNLDYKVADYDWDAGQLGNLELTKDIMAMANLLGPSSEPAYILVGVEQGTGRIAGIAHHQDDAALHQKVQPHLNRMPDFVYGPVDVDGVTVGVYEIRPGGRPFFPLRDGVSLKDGRNVTVLRKNNALVRVGTSTDVASPTEIIEWSREDDPARLELHTHALVKARAEKAVLGHATVASMSTGTNDVEIHIDVENTGRSAFAVESLCWEGEWLPRFFAGTATPNASGYQGTELPTGYRPPQGDLPMDKGFIYPGRRMSFFFKWTRLEALEHFTESGLVVNGFIGNWAAYHFSLRCRSDLGGTSELRCTARQ